MDNVINLFGDTENRESEEDTKKEIVSFLKSFTEQVANGETEKGVIIYVDDGGLKMRALGHIDGWGEMMLILKAAENTVLAGYISDIAGEE